MHSDDQVQPDDDPMSSDDLTAPPASSSTTTSPPTHYPEDQMDFAEPLPEEWQQFADLREAILLDYGYQTARAYWADLQDWFIWAVERDKDVLLLTEREIRQYVALLRRRHYSENTVRRRIVTLRKLYTAAVEAGVREDNPAERVVVRVRNGQDDRFLLNLREQMGQICELP